MRRVFLAFALLVSSFIKTNATVLYVSLNATGNNDGTTWANAYTNLQAAIDAAASGDSIFVAQATYQPATNTAFSMKEGVKIFGGFIGTETDFAQRNLANKATLQGNRANVMLNVNNGLTSAALLDGFFITSGYQSLGGGIYNSSVSPTISNCIFSNNQAASYGGGIFNYNSSPTITNCGFSNNSTQSGGGGGMANTGTSRPVIMNCIFTGNSAFNGGAIYEFASTGSVITNCTFAGNTAIAYGGGLCNTSLSVTVTNCTFAANSAGSGGGILNSRAGAVISNTIIWGNTSGLVSLNSTVTVTYSNLQDGVISGTGNLSLDPLFTDAASMDFTLQSGSPCIDAGTPDTTGLNIGIADLAGKGRIAGESVDMGAYEFGNTLPVTLISFSAKPVATHSVELEWATAQETQNARFVIERSKDLVSFEPVVEIRDVAGNSSTLQTYKAVDPMPYSGTSYYRLIQYDIDGTRTVSRIVSVIARSRDYAVYPNLVQSQSFRVSVDEPVTAKIEARSASGQTIPFRRKPLDTQAVEISPLASLLPGTYLITVQERAVKRTFSLIVQ
ncbi:right-handed parallel beta-helix repeat-containing protein [Dyadobacter sp. 676]|uniref:Right-handed parallel beta-helix repeat-containing protein n=1 Tax=Dyadobacter sp. 676 TaxID=3088362 RepID=A0AAU8FHQ2_9BACT